MPGEAARMLEPPLLSGTLRAEAEDFRVEELPLVEPTGEGAHLWLEIEKRGANTAWVAGRLAEAARAPAREVGYAGMKDRHAVTRQWFSVGLQQAADADWEGWDIPGVRILRAARNPRKLRRGALRGNRFALRVRILEGGPDDLPVRIEALRRSGVPNYFGPQRFGHGGGNLARGLAWLSGGGRASRSDRSLWLSAVRSGLFNAVLSERLRRGDWDRLLDGEVAQLDGRRSTFVCQLPDADLEARCAAHDLHPTGPLPGAPGRANRPERQAAELEAGMLAPHQDTLAALTARRVEADRRALRVLPAELQGELEDGVLSLSFSLPPGAYATAVLRELVCTPEDTIYTLS